MKKLDSLKIPFASEGSEQSSSSDNSEISCQSSITSSATKNPEEKESKSQIPNSPKCEIEEKLEKPDSPTVSQDSTELQSNPSSKDTKNDEHRYLIQTCILISNLISNYEFQKHQLD